MKPACPGLRRLLFLCLLTFLWPAGRATGQTVVAWGRNTSGLGAVPEGLTDVIAVAGGSSHSLALRADGSVVAWAGATTFDESTVPEGLANVIAVAAGDYHSLALKADGSVVAWGYNGSGQSTVPEGLANVVAVAAGNSHSLALKADGTVVGWGVNRLSTVPVGLAGVIAVAAGISHSLALKADGTVVAWGDNHSGQSSVPEGLANVTAVAAGGSLSLALKADGSLVAWGTNGFGQIMVPEGLTDVIAVEARSGPGSGHSLALKADGSVVAWGRNDFGESTVPDGLSNVTAVAVGWEHSLALTGSSTAAFSLVSAPRALAAADFPFHYRIRTTQPPGTPLAVTNLPAGLTFDAASGVISGTPTVAGTFTVPIALEAGGSQASLQLTIWGAPAIGPLPSVVVWPVLTSVEFPLCASGAPVSFSATGLPPGISIEPATGRILGSPTTPGVYAATVTATNRFGSASISMTVEVTLVAAWGGGQNNLLPSGLTDVIAVAGGSSHSLALKADGSVVAWGDNNSGQSTVPEGLDNVIAVAAGSAHSLALKADGSVVAWGDNYYGQSTVPEGLANVIAVAAGFVHSLALKADGSVVAWGNNGYGQSTVPPGLANVIAVAAGGFQSLALKADGSIVAWGRENPVPAELDNVIAVAAGGYHSLALKADGSIVAWDQFQSTVPEGLANVIAITAGEEHSLALKADGSVVAWGRNVEGQSTLPEGLANVTAVAAGTNHSLALIGSSTTAFSLVSAPRASAAADFPFHYRIRTTLPPGTPLAVTNLPAGLTFDAASGVISGTPTQVGTFTVQIAPAAGGAQASLQLTVWGAPMIGPAPSPVIWPAHASVLEFQFSASGAPASFSATGLPPGISIDSATGRILGTPSARGVYAVIVTAANRFGSASLSVTVEVTPVAAWGGVNQFGQRNVPAGLADAVAVAAGDHHSLALKADGSVVAWGDNRNGESTVPAGLANVIAVAGGGAHSLALQANGSVVAWGDDSYGQSTVPGGLADVIALAAGEDHSLALKADGSVVAWGRIFEGQTTVPAGLADVIAVAAGEHHSLALKANGSVVAWGDNGTGQSLVPVGLTNVIAVAAGTFHSLALKADGSVVSWGNNSSGEVPAELASVIAVEAGANYSLALKADGFVITWDNNPNSQSTGPAGPANVIAVAGGGFHSLALTRNLPPPPIAHFAAAGQPLSIPGPGAKAGCTYRVTGLPAWLTVDPLTGTISGTAPATFTALILTRELRYRAGYTVEEQALSILPAWYSSYAAWQTHNFGSTTTPQSQPAADDDGDGQPNLLEFLTGSNPNTADSGAFTSRINGGAFSLSLDVLPGMETAATLRARFSNDLTFTAPAEVTIPTRTETLPNGLRRLVFEDPASTGAARRFARLVSSLP